MRATVVLMDGRTLQRRIDHAVGSLERPMTDGDLEEKFVGLTEGVLPGPQIRELIDRCWTVETLPNAADIAAAARVG